MSANDKIHLDVSLRELRVLVESLSHCLATCKQREHDAQARCADCDTAERLRERMQRHLPN